MGSYITNNNIIVFNISWGLTYIINDKCIYINISCIFDHMYLIHIWM